MQIEQIKVRKVHGTMKTEGNLWEERLLMPLDIYEEFRKAGQPASVNQIDANHYKLSTNFVEIKTESGHIGLAGPFDDDAIAHIIISDLKPMLLGRDAFATEFLWDVMHRSMPHGRGGRSMMALSAIDCALWDLKGRALNVPVYSLIGGPTRSEIPAYASMLGYAVEDMGLVKERAIMAKDRGFRAQKWFFRHGPMSGHEGFGLNIALVRTLRETLGDDYDIMLDCWQSMNLTYAARLAEAIEEYRPRWLEEPGLPDRIDTYRELRSRTTIPISGAEHAYTRWGVRSFIDQEALDVLQPDIYWCGGLSETLKIATLGTAHDLITIPHGHSTPATIHFSLSQPPIHTPYQEYLLKWNEVHQYFLHDPLKPVDGLISAPTASGMNMDINMDKVENEEEVLV